MEACELAGLVFTPLFFNVYSSRIFEPDRAALLRPLALILSAAWTTKLIDQRHRRRQPADHTLPQSIGGGSGARNRG